MSSGEALTYDLVEKFNQKFDAKLHNLYGPTEAAVDVSYWECEAGEDRSHADRKTDLEHTTLRA